jgi:DNA-binding transcriptional ArsR family regulator
MSGVRRIVETRVLVSRMLTQGMSRGEIAAALNVSKSTVSYHARRLGHAVELERLLVADTYRSRHNLKNRLIRAGIKQNRCEKCGLTDSRGRPLSMALHHINGDGRDNRLPNLQFLCPNCHSQTENFSGRGRRRIEAA